MLIIVPPSREIQAHLEAAEVQPLPGFPVRPVYSIWELPVAACGDFKNEITKEIDKELAKLYAIFDVRVKELNKKVKESQIDLI